MDKKQIKVNVLKYLRDKNEAPKYDEMESEFSVEPQVYEETLKEMKDEDKTISDDRDRAFTVGESKNKVHHVFTEELKITKAGLDYLNKNEK